MTITLLASVSLFALVVSSRPLLPSDLQLQFRPPSELGSAIQAVFQVHPGKDELISDQARVQDLAAEQQHKYIPKSDAESSEACISFGSVPGQKASVEETFLKEPIDASQGDSDNPDLDVDAEGLGTLTSVLALPADEERLKSDNDEPSSTLLLVLAFSCIAALSALACTALTLYVTKHLCSRTLTSQTTWHLLPRFRKLTVSLSPSQTAHPRSGFDRTLAGNSLPLQIWGPRLSSPDAGVGTLEKHALHVGEKHIDHDAVSAIPSESDDVQEKYEDMLDTTPLPPTYELPPNRHGQPSFMDPPLPYVQFGSSVLPHPQTNHIVPATREVSPSSVSRPAWSARATDSSPLGLTPLETSVNFNSQALVHSRRRAYRAVPEFDVALAMQLRPGLGTGADSAWMVRFLMAIFGWFAVALAGNR